MSIARKPKVSVMVVTYNQADLIRETLDSILDQDYENLEIVVADDASTDGNQAIIQDYASRFPGKIVPVLNECNQGITGNCNAAFFACTGELIATMGGDDVFLPGKLTAQVEVFVRDPDVTLSYHPVEVFESATNRVLYVTNQNPNEDSHGALDIIKAGGIPGASSVMVRRSACPETGFDRRLPVVSDWMFYVEAALQGKVVKIDPVYGRYRKHGKGASDRSYELLSETLLTLDLLMEKYPESPPLKEACRLGRARYLAGEGFRQLGKNYEAAEDLARQAALLEPSNLKYRLLFALTSLLRRLRFLRALVPALLNAKYTLKKYLPPQ